MPSVLKQAPWLTRHSSMYIFICFKWCGKQIGFPSSFNLSVFKTSRKVMLRINSTKKTLLLTLPCFLNIGNCIVCLVRTFCWCNINLTNKT